MGGTEDGIIHFCVCWGFLYNEALSYQTAFNPFALSTGQCRPGTCVMGTLLPLPVLVLSSSDLPNNVPVLYYYPRG